MKEALNSIEDAIARLGDRGSTEMSLATWDDLTYHLAHATMHAEADIEAKIHTVKTLEDVGNFLLGMNGDVPYETWWKMYEPVKMIRETLHNFYHTKL